jgi:hypothetical protein
MQLDRSKLLNRSAISFLIIQDHVEIVRERVAGQGNGRRQQPRKTHNRSSKRSQQRYGTATI